MKVRMIDTTCSHFEGEVGTAMHLEIEGFDSRLKSSLVGILPSEFLILKLPPLGTYVGQPRHIDPESEILVRYLHKGSVWGFRSTVKRVISTPAGLLLINIPQTIESYDLRQEERIDCRLPGKLKLGSTRRQGTVVDLSKKGCRFLIEIAGGKKAPKIQIEDELEFLCSFPGVEGEQALTGCVRQIHQDQQGIAVGMEFVEPDPKIKSVIVDYIKSVSP